MKVLAGVDIGTQGTKTVLYSQTGERLAHAFAPSTLLQPRAGTVEEDPEKQVNSVCQTLRRCMKESRIDSKSLAGIGIVGQMAGVIGIGKDGLHVTPYDSWLDTRCASQIQQMEAAAGAAVVQSAGAAPGFNHGPKMLWWEQERPKSFRRIAAFVQPGAYAAMRLCGLNASDAFIDTTYLHFSGFADNRKSAWNASLCQQFDFAAEKLPRIVEPQKIVGGVSESMARRCGIRAGLPVVAGCGDTAASFLACGAVRAGVGVDVAGTASVFAATTDSFRPDVKHRMLGCGRSAVPGLWHPYAYINGGGMNLEWFRREIASGGAVRSNGMVSFEQLNALAARISPKDDVPMFVPHLGGRACPSDPSLRGAWVGLMWAHTQAHLYRAALEAVALEYSVYQRVLAGLYPKFSLSELRVTGGGEKSGLWNEIKADVLGTPVRRIDNSDGAPCGAAMLAGWGVGLLESLPAAARSWVVPGPRISPNRSHAPHYARRSADYESLLKRLHQPAAPARQGRTGS